MPASWRFEAHLSIEYITGRKELRALIWGSCAEWVQRFYEGWLCERRRIAMT